MKKLFKKIDNNIVKKHIFYLYNIQYGNPI